MQYAGRISINTRNEVDGSKILDYEGNWRDIFQNWEALAHSYPEFIESMIHKFLNEFRAKRKEVRRQNTCQHTFFS